MNSKNPKRTPLTVKKIEKLLETAASRFRAKGKIYLKSWPTNAKWLSLAKEAYSDLVDRHQRQLNRLQSLHFLSHRNAVLIIFQGMDSAGKDGVIKHLMGGLNAQGCRVFSFKHPTAAELKHDFLWRTLQNLPERGQIAIYNRSYYEEVLITRVHRNILTAEALRNDVCAPSRGDLFWNRRYLSIRQLEQHLCQNGTKVIKFFLHLSHEEQRLRFLDRILDVDKNYKITKSDMNERKAWPRYQKAYEKCIQATHSQNSPWYIVPADDKHTARLLISRILIDVFESFAMKPPSPSMQRVRGLRAIKRILRQKTV